MTRNSKTLVWCDEIRGELLRELIKRTAKTDLTELVPYKRLILCSCGGDAYAAFGVCDLVERAKIIVHGTGQLMSGAVPIIAAGRRGQRLVTPRTRFMVHAPWWQTDSTLTEKDLSTEHREMAYIAEVYAEIMARHSKKDKAFWLKMMRDAPSRYFPPKQAKTWGVIDGVI